MNRPRPLTNQQAIQKAREYWENGWYLFWGHAKARMTERQIVDLDIHEAIQNGSILRDPEWNSASTEWRYRIEGLDMEGEEITVIVSFEEGEFPTLHIVTCF